MKESQTKTERAGLLDWLRASALYIRFYSTPTFFSTYYIQLLFFTFLLSQPTTSHIFPKRKPEIIDMIDLPKQSVYAMIPSPGPSIESDRLLLRPVTDSDASALFGIRSCPEVAETK